jgi:hypothetical protein
VKKFLSPGEAGGSPVQGQMELHREIIPQNLSKQAKPIRKDENSLNKDENVAQVVEHCPSMLLGSTLRTREKLLNK